MRTTARASAKGILLPPQDPAHCVPVREIRFRIDLGSIEERGKVDSRLRDDFENFSAVAEDDLSSSWPFLSPFRGDHDSPLLVDFLEDSQHVISLKICQIHQIMAHTSKKGSFPARPPGLRR